ncbi:hypothetical protein EON65_25155 [archaeon]|nr:MAG: hypothetical protein EON65_25155 [archaeon]
MSDASSLTDIIHSDAIRNTAVKRQLALGRKEGAGRKENNVLVGCSGSVATLKVPEIAVELINKNYNVLIVCTDRAKFFLQRAREYNTPLWRQFEDAEGPSLILEDHDEWEAWNKIGNVVLHIELRKWADIMIVAPASADLLSKASIGISDNIVLSVMRAWDFSKPCLLAPAMNTLMWEHPATAESLSKLVQWGWKVVSPVEKLLACNDKGVGAMASVADIVSGIEHALTHSIGSTSAVVSLNASNRAAVRSSLLGSLIGKLVQFSDGRFSDNVQIGIGMGVGLGFSVIVGSLALVILDGMSSRDFFSFDYRGTTV